MFSFIVIILECLAIIFIGSFGRTTTASINNTASVSSAITLLLAFTLMYFGDRRLSLFPIIMLLFVTSIAMQTNLLLGTFWDSCFTGFSSQFTIGVSKLMRGLFASLSALLTMLDFIGLFEYWQVFAIMVSITTIGYSLCSAVLMYGIKIFDGGQGLQAFLFSGTVSLAIWALCVRGRISPELHIKKQSYINQTLALIGVVIAFASWPLVNVGGALNSVSSSTLTDSTSLQSSALANTIIALLVPMCVSLFLASGNTENEKMKVKVYIDCFVNSGISCASYSDVSLDPVVGMIAAIVATIVTLVLDKYIFESSTSQRQLNFRTIMAAYCKVFYRILFSFLGIILGSIVVATRQSKTPALLDSNYSAIAGLQIAAFFITLIIAFAFGALAAVMINVYVSYRTKQKIDSSSAVELIDTHFFDELSDQIFPIYYDLISETKKDALGEIEMSHRIIQESLIKGAYDSVNPITSMNVKENTPRKVQRSRNPTQSDNRKSNVSSSVVVEPKRVVPRAPPDSKVSSNFTKNNPHVEPSKINEKKVEEPKPYMHENSEFKVRVSAVPASHSEVRNQPIVRRISYSQDSQVQEENTHTKALQRLSMQKHDAYY